MADGAEQRSVVARAAGESWTDALVVKNTFLEPREPRCNSSSSRSSSGPARSTSGASGWSSVQPVLAAPPGGPPRPPKTDAHRSSGSRDPQSRAPGQTAQGEDVHKIWGAPELGDENSNESSQLEHVFHDIKFEGSDASSKVATSIVASSGMSEYVPEEGDQKPDSVDEAQVPTIGSELHSVGQCKPCFWLQSKDGCENGSSCQFCHLPHERVVRIRPCKTKRARAKKRAGELAAELGDPDELTMAAEQLVNQNGYLKTVMQSKARSIAAGLGPNGDMPKKPPKEKLVVSL